MKKNLTFILPALCLLLAGMVIFNLFIRKDENYGEGFDGDSDASYVYDQADIFDDDKETLRELNTLVDEYSNKLDMNIYVFINGDRSFYSDSEVKRFCDSYYDNKYGEHTDGILYLIDISGGTPARDCISTSGKAVLLYEKNLDRIFSSMDAYLPSSGSTVYPDDIDGAVREFFDQIEHYGRRTPGIFESYHDKVRGYYHYYRNGEYIVSTHNPATKFIFLLISAVVGIMTGIISFISIKSKYRFKGGTNSSVYVAHGENKLTESSDIFIRSYVTKRKIETSSSSGGGRSGGGGGHSGSHGGGVHHR